VAIKLLGCLAVGVTAAGTLVLGGCVSSAQSFQIGNCINWSIDSNGDNVPMKVSCNNPPDPDIDVVKAIVPNGQSCTSETGSTPRPTAQRCALKMSTSCHRAADQPGSRPPARSSHERKVNDRSPQSAPAD